MTGPDTDPRKTAQPDTDWAAAMSLIRAPVIPLDVCAARLASGQIGVGVGVIGDDGNGGTIDTVGTEEGAGTIILALLGPDGSGLCTVLTPAQLDNLAHLFADALEVSDVLRARLRTRLTDRFTDRITGGVTFGADVLPFKPKGPGR